MHDDDDEMPDHGTMPWVGAGQLAGPTLVRQVRARCQWPGYVCHGVVQLRKYPCYFLSFLVLGRRKFFFNLGCSAPSASLS